MRITLTEQAVLTEAIIEESGGDKTKYQVHMSLSTGLAARSWAKSCTPSVRSGVHQDSQHWDFKLMLSLTDNQRREEQLTVIVGNNFDMKLRGTPCYQPESNVSAGELIASRTMDLLYQWHSTDTIVSMCFDTTASNTGLVTIHA